ncbi:hypothetical protein HCC61_05665 [Streptomyces sp. HNM0575]|uniref:hypothetical protein n=1 Tax=Streptomyces sp. HNM0575 TaxID=2716338 RepID=UPI00145D35BC|nr:hypothetical protein [Streptomyces sp. HNM0575]NLU72177.1 hypothetical protein [Streptomyces sp. HNM0575]
MADHDCRRLESSYSQVFHEYLESLPWIPSKVDWSRIPHKFVSLESDDTAAELRLIDETPIGRNPYVMVTFNADDMAIMCRAEDAFRDADSLYMRAPGPRYMCGAKFESDGIVLSVEDFAEYDLPGFTVRL